VFWLKIASGLTQTRDRILKSTSIYWIKDPVLAQLMHGGASGPKESVPEQARC